MQSQTQPAIATRPRTYVLVHGAWCGAWVWKRVANELRSLGHTVYTPTLTGLGERKHLAGAGIDLDTHTDDVVNLIEMEDLDDIVLVGWSYGGMVTSNVLSRIASRIASVVYLDAFVPEAGKNLCDYAGPPSAEFLRQAAAGNDLAHIPLIVFGVSDPEVEAYVTPKLALQPHQTLTQPSRAPAQRPAIPHTYVRALQFDPSPFERFYEQFKSDPAWKVHQLDTSHLTMLTDPEGTVDILANVD